MPITAICFKSGFYLPYGFSAFEARCFIFSLFFFFHSLDTFNLISNKKKEKFLNKKKTKPNSKSMIMDAKILV